MYLGQGYMPVRMPGKDDMEVSVYGLSLRSMEQTFRSNRVGARRGGMLCSE